MSSLSSTIIQDIETLCKAGQASMAYFYFEFRDADKQNLHDLVPSLLTQLSARSASSCDILSNLYLDHNKGKRQPSDDVLAQCLKEMLALPDQRPVYLIIDALDECPDSHGISSPRERLLQLVKELVELHFPNLHICVTSRPEIDIREVLDPLTSLRVCLHDQTGQKEDIADYIRSVVYSDSESIMKRWRTEDKELVIETLSNRANGMSVNYCWFVMIVQTVKQVSLGVFPAGNLASLSSTEYPTYPGGTTGIFGRDVRTRTEGNQEAEPRSRAPSCAMPCCRYSTPSGGGAGRGPRCRFR